MRQVLNLTQAKTTIRRALRCTWAQADELAGAVMQSLDDQNEMLIADPRYLPSYSADVVIRHARVLIQEIQEKR